MLIPSIDLIDGQAVQLVGGEIHALSAGDPRPLARRFGRVGAIAVIDLDAALGQGSNRHLIQELCRIARCRVGGGIRDLETARAWLDAGAEQIILGTAASPELLSQLPRPRVIAALDARDGEVVVKGWREGTGRGVAERMAELAPYVSGFLVTFVEREGRLGGTDMAQARALVAAAQGVPVTFAGGITKAEEIAQLDALGADAQVGMALYTGRLGLAQAFAAPLRSDRRDDLWPTVVVDEHERALGLCYSSAESLEQALERGAGVYQSRTRGLWIKGAKSGNTQELLAVDMDCDRDTLRFTVRQTGPGFCHRNTASCWGDLGGLPHLAQRLKARKDEAPAGSYTARLLEEPALLRAKLLEEAAELADALGASDVCHESADLLYFTLVAMVRGGVELGEVQRTLERRALGWTRRPGDAKVRV